MIPTQIYIEAFKRIAFFKIKYKSTSFGQRLLGFLIKWYSPNYLTHYTTVVGKSIYLPDEQLVNHPTTRFTIAHEVVHLLDQQRLTLPLFLLLYLSPQIFALGILSFPWLGYDALWFILFALPWPSPGRVYLEARAYAVEMNLYARYGYTMYRDRYIDIFQSPDYYFMSWSRKFSARLLFRYLEVARKNEDPVFKKIIDTFNACNDT